MINFHPIFTQFSNPTVLYVNKDSELLKNTSVGALAKNRVKTLTNSIETITQESITQSLTTIEYLL